MNEPTISLKRYQDMCETKDKYMAQVMQLEYKLADKDKVIQTLWELAKASYTCVDDCEFAGFLNNSETAQQFTEKLLGGKDDSGQ